MISTDELFADRGSDALYDVFVGLDLINGVEPQDRSPQRLRVLFECLPERIRNIAHEWGLGDTVFRDEAYCYFRERTREEYAP